MKRIYPDITKRLRSFLDASEPKMIALLVHFWGAQQNVMTYAELREAIINESVSDEELEQWREDYAVFVNTYLAPAWYAAIEDAVKPLEDMYDKYEYSPSRAGAMDWAAKHAAELVQNLSDQQEKAINALIQRAVSTNAYSVDELARAIRPFIGLDDRQAPAALNYYNFLRESGVSRKKAQEASANRAGEMHRYRAERIARNELAVGYRAGARIGIEDAQNMGYMGETVKRWSTADDERVCPICAPMDGVETPMNEPFIVGGMPIEDDEGAHISCRCGKEGFWA